MKLKKGIGGGHTVLSNLLKASVVLLVLALTISVVSLNTPPVGAVVDPTLTVSESASELSVVNTWTDQKVRDVLKREILEVSLPQVSFFQKETETEPSSVQETQEPVFPISPISKVQALDCQNKPFFNSKTVKSVVALDEDSYEGMCIGCEEKRVLHWHVTNLKDEWADVCQDCGMKIQEKMKKESDV
jgi:hypothetical protein